MGFWGWLFGGDPGGKGGSGNHRIYSGAARSSARVPAELPYSRVWPYALLVDLNIIRARSKWLARNNMYAAAAARDLPSLITGATGILPGIDEPVWQSWAMDARQCHADGRLSLYGLQWHLLRAVVTTGEGFIVRRARRADSPWPLPMQLVVLDGDALAHGPTRRPLAAGARVSYGIEFGRRGQRVGYHFRVQSPDGWSEDVMRVDAADVIHVYDPIEPEMQRGVPWFAPAIIPLADMGNFNESALKKADVAASIAAFTTRLDDVQNRRMFGGPDDDPDQQLRAPYELPLTPGSEVHIPDLPRGDSVKDYNDASLSGISAALGTGVELLTGDYRGMPFSAARMSRGERDLRVRGWRARLLRPAMRRIWEWAREAAMVRGLDWPVDVEWPEPPPQEVEPDKEGRASAQHIRAGLTTWSDEVRRRGHVPEALAQRIADDLALFDRLGLTLDIDARRVTAQGQAQHEPPAEPPDGDGGGDDDGREGREGREESDDA